MFKSLKAKIVLTYSLLFFLGSVIVFTALNGAKDKQIRAKVESISQLTADVASSGIAVAIHTNDLGFIQEAMEKVKRDSMVRFVELILDDVVLASINPDSLKISDFNTITKTISNGVYFCSSKIEYEGEKLGEIHLGYSTSLEDAIQSETLLNLGSIFGGVLILIALINILLFHPIFKLFKKLKESFITYNNSEEIKEVQDFKSIELSEVANLYNSFLIDVDNNKDILVEKKAIEDSLKFKDEFLANMSHEIRTPMNGIVGIIEVLLREDSLQSQHKELLQTINNSSQTLLSIINDILDLSKLESGKMDLHEIEVNPKDILKHVYDLFESKANEKSLNINILDDGTLPSSVKIDQNRLVQILSNLISNAVKFTDSGEIIIRSNWENDFWNIEVEDSGIGISEDNIKLLFQKFSQLDSTSTKSYEGTGLGLSISQKLAEIMGGGISVSSKFGKGTIFNVRVKALVGNNIENPVTLKRTNDVQNGRILVVDDKKVNLTVAKLMLEKCNCTVTIASSGAEALDIFQDHKFDFIFMDIQMPELDGVETMKRIMEKSTFPPQIIALTANALEGYREKYINYGFDNYISKPLTFDSIKSVLG